MPWNQGHRLAGQQGGIIGTRRARQGRTTTKRKEHREAEVDAQVLKIRVKPWSTHWLYRNRTRDSMNPASGGNTRISTLVRGTSNDTQIGDEENEIHVLRRVLSTPTLFSFSCHRPYDRQDQDQDQGIDVWGTVVLSSLDRLVSSSHSHFSHRPATMPNFVELPINDLLFVCTVPSLPSASSSLIHASERTMLGPLPPRQYKELSRVLLYVPHLPEVVVYHETSRTLSAAGTTRVD